MGRLQLSMRLAAASPAVWAMRVRPWANAKFAREEDHPAACSFASIRIYPGTQGGEPTIVRRMNPRVAQLDGAMLTAAGLVQIDRSVTALQYVTTPPPDIEEEWRTAIARVHPRLRGAIVPADIFDAVVATLAEYRAKRGSTP